MRFFFNIKTLFFAIIILTSIVWFLFPNFFYKLKSEGISNEKLTRKIIHLAANSLISQDVPVGCVLLYNDTIIGEGFNTVLRDSVAYGHAEINAISSAIKKIGLNAFSKLDRNKLILITTLEPCKMCEGAIIEYRIKHVQFAKNKDLKYWFKENKWELLYQYHKQKIQGDKLQDSLFNLHPKYTKQDELFKFKN